MNIVCKEHDTWKISDRSLSPSTTFISPTFSRPHLLISSLSLPRVYCSTTVIFLFLHSPLSVLFFSFYRIFSQPITFHLVLVRSSVLWSPEGRQEQITIKINLFLKIPNYIINLVINLKPIMGYNFCKPLYPFQIIRHYNVYSNDTSVY